MSIRIPPALRYYPKFRLLWLGLMISVAGTQMQSAALLWNIRDLSTATDRPGGIGLARILPVIVFSLIGGAVADAVNRKTLLLVTQSFMAVFAVGLAILAFSEKISLGSIYLLTALNALAMSLSTCQPGRRWCQIWYPAEDLPSAFSLTSIGVSDGSDYRAWARRFSHRLLWYRLYLSV